MRSHEDSNPAQGGSSNSGSRNRTESGHYDPPDRHTPDRSDKSIDPKTQLTSFDSIFKYEGMDWLTYDDNISLELSSSLSIEGIPAVSVSLDQSNRPLQDRLSIDIPLGSGKLSIGADGSLNAAVGWDLKVPLTDYSVAGVEVSANLRCPDEGKCYDFGAKAKAGPLSFKYEGAVRMGPGSIRASQDLLRNLENSIRANRF
ncbi:hypothetical protein [Pseudorhodoferax sp.]|uniref:hypothetical protein n=1 Tax=Pseudorhodoferax sp. TaxID=1993553 RepID=UPI0039E3D089